MQDVDRSILTGCQADIRSTWRQVILTDLVYKLIAFVLITPAIGCLFRLFLALSGREILADEDILYFVLSPVGVATVIIVGAISVGTLAFEQAALMTIVFAGQQGPNAGIRQALLFVASRAVPILHVTARLIGLVLLITAPFLAAAGLAYRLMLTEFDINYYLQHRPPEFISAVGMGVLLILGWFVVLIPILAARLMAFPLILFESVAAREALRRSVRRTMGQRLRITMWLVLWSVSTFLLSLALSTVVAWIGRVAVTPSLGSLHWIVLTVGVILGLWLAVNAATTLVAVTTLAVLLTNLYRRLAMSDTATLTTSAIHPSRPAKALLRLTRTTIMLGCLITLAVVTSLGLLLVNRQPIEDHSAIMAHRGASGVAPENTMASILQAISDGADWVEIDVQETLDGQVVVLHDSDLKRIGQSSLRPWESNTEQLRSVDIGSWFDKQFSDQRVPTLDEVLTVCDDRINVNIELKYYGYDRNLEERVVELVKAHGMDDSVIIMSLKKTGIDKLKKLEPTWPAGLLTATAVGDISRVNVDFLAVNVGMASRRFIRAVQKRGKQVFVWTVNDPLTMSTMMGRGVDAIITDNPAMARMVRQQRQQMSPIERLLAQLASIIGSPVSHDLDLDDV